MICVGPNMFFFHDETTKFDSDWNWYFEQSCVVQYTTPVAKFVWCNRHFIDSWHFDVLRAFATWMLLFFFAVHLTLSQHGIGPILELIFKHKSFELIFKHKSLSSKFSTTWYRHSSTYAVFWDSKNRVSRKLCC